MKHLQELLFLSEAKTKKFFTLTIPAGCKATEKDQNALRINEGKDLDELAVLFEEDKKSRAMIAREKMDKIANQHLSETMALIRKVPGVSNIKNSIPSSRENPGHRHFNEYGSIYLDCDYKGAELSVTIKYGEIDNVYGVAKKDDGQLYSIRGQLSSLKGLDTVDEIKKTFDAVLEMSKRKSEEYEAHKAAADKEAKDRASKKAAKIAKTAFGAADLEKIKKNPKSYLLWFLKQAEGEDAGVDIDYLQSTLYQIANVSDKVEFGDLALKFDDEREKPGLVYVITGSLRHKNKKLITIEMEVECDDKEETWGYGHPSNLKITSRI